MSAAFDLLPQPEEQGSPVSKLDEQRPDLFAGALGSVPYGVMAGSAKIGIAGSLAASNLATFTDAATNGTTHYGDWIFNHMVDPLTDSLDRIDKLTANQGAISQVLGGLASAIPTANIMGPVGLGVVTGVVRAAQESKKQGLDESYELGTVEGGFAYATAALPMRIHFAAGITAKTFKNAVYGAFVGGAGAVAEPAIEKGVYMVNGQPDDAAKINVFDARSIVANMTLGVFFSTLGKHPASPLVDAALNENDLQTRGKTGAGAANQNDGANATLEMERDVAAGTPAVDAVKQHEVPLSDEAISELRKSGMQTLEVLPIDAPKPEDPLGAKEQTDAAPEALEPTQAVPKIEQGEETPATAEKAPELAPGQREIDVPGFGKVKLDQNHDIPWAGGSSNDGSTVYAQKGMNLIENVNGKDYDFGIPLGIHEMVERKLEKQGEDYEPAHEAAEAAEDKWVSENWPEISSQYENLWKPKIDFAEQRANSGDVNVPKDLVVKPYDHPDNPLERKMHEEVFGAEGEKPQDEAQPKPEKTAQWSPENDDGESETTPYEKIQQLADQLDNQGAVDPVTGQKAGDAIRQAMDMMKLAKQSQSVIDEAAQCVVGALNG